MVTTGIIKKSDDLGRIVIPRSVRHQAFGTHKTDGKSMEVFYENDGKIIEVCKRIIQIRTENQALIDGLEENCNEN